MVPTNALTYIKISWYTHWTPTCFAQPYVHLQGCKIQSYIKPLSFTSLEDGHMISQDNVGFHCVYKQISIYSCAFVDTFVVNISGDLCNCWVKLMTLNTIKSDEDWSCCRVTSQLRTSRGRTVPNELLALVTHNLQFTAAHKTNINNNNNNKFGRGNLSSDQCSLQLNPVSFDFLNTCSRCIHSKIKVALHEGA